MAERNKKIVAITQARTGSTRLPGKVLLEVQNMPFLEIHLKRVSMAKLIDEVVVATTVKESDDAIADLVLKLGYKLSRGPEDDVLERYYNAATAANADIVVRITSDCPLIDPEIIDAIIEAHIKYSKDFTSNIITRTYPDGMDVEVFSMDALTKAWNEAKDKADREHVTYYIWKNSDLMEGKLFTSHNVVAENNVDFSNLRLTLDYPEDLELITKLIELKGIDKTWIDYVDTLNDNPALIEINKYV
jgi:spore coat polysaccharide biosynthesis protein SpsF